MLTYEERVKAILASSLVHKETLVGGLQRLVDGDLSHIGDAIANGYEIEFRGFRGDLGDGGSRDFSGDVDRYRVKGRMFDLGGIEIPMPAKIEDVEIGEEYWFADLVSNDVESVMTTEDQIELAKKEATEAAIKLENLKNAYALETCPFNIGDIVDMVGWKHKGEKIKITSICAPRFSYDLRWKVFGAILKADGTVGKNFADFSETDYRVSKGE